MRNAHRHDESVRNERRDERAHHAACEAAKTYPEDDAMERVAVTAETISDAEIESLGAADGDDQDLGDYSSIRELKMFARRGRPSARRRCAELLNNRAPTSPATAGEE